MPSGVAEAGGVRSNDVREEHAAVSGGSANAGAHAWRGHCGKIAGGPDAL